MDQETKQEWRDYQANPLTDEENKQRIEHVIQRLKERAKLTVDALAVAMAERSIRKAKSLLAQGKALSPIHARPVYLNEKKGIEVFRVLIGGRPAHLVFCKNRGVISVEHEHFRINRFRRAQHRAKGQSNAS